MKTLLLAVLLLAGCADYKTPGELYPHANAVANSIVYCGNKTECNAMWDRGRQWIIDESQFRIFISGQDLVKTFGPDYRDPERAQDLSYEMRRQENADGSAVIEILGICGREIQHCYDLQLSRADFKLYVRGY